MHGLHLVAGAGDPVMKSGLGMYIFAAGKDMNEREAFYNADGDFLIVSLSSGITPPIYPHLQLQAKLNPSRSSNTAP